MNECSIAIIGATGAVGQVFLNILEERDFPLKSVRLCASERSVGKKLKLRGEEIAVELATPQLLSEVDFAFIAASTAISRELAPIAAENGAVAIDDSSAFRMQDNVPLVVPEVNGDDLRLSQRASSPYRTAAQPLSSWLSSRLHEQNAVRRVIAATYQSVTGTGAAAAQELRDQSGDILAGRETSAEIYPAPDSLQRHPARRAVLG